MGSMGTYDDIVTGCIWSIFKVKGDQVFSKTPIAHLVDFVQYKIKEIKS